MQNRRLRDLSAIFRIFIGKSHARFENGAKEFRGFSSGLAAARIAPGGRGTVRSRSGELERAPAERGGPEDYRDEFRR